MTIQAQETISDCLKRHLSDVDGILGIYISDEDGVILAFEKLDSDPEPSLHPSIIATFVNVIQQSGKMGLGQMKHMLARYNDMQICQFNFSEDKKMAPVYLTIVGSRNCDVGMMLSLKTSLKEVVSRLIVACNDRLLVEASALRLAQEQQQHFQHRQQLQQTQQQQFYQQPEHDGLGYYSQVDFSGTQHYYQS